MAESLKYFQAVSDIYFRRKTFRNLPSDISKDTVCSVKSALPEDLPEDSSANGCVFGRATRKLLGMSCKGIYSELELKAAMRSVLFDNQTYVYVLREYGVPERTVRDHLFTVATKFGYGGVRELRDHLSFHAEECQASIKMFIEVMKIPPVGKKPYMDQTEVDIMFQYTDHAAQHGNGYNTTQTAVSGPMLCDDDHDDDDSNDNSNDCIGRGDVYGDVYRRCV
jgi:hypothetical protein